MSLYINILFLTKNSQLLSGQPMKQPICDYVHASFQLRPTSIISGVFSQFRSPSSLLVVVKFENVETTRESSDVNFFERMCRFARGFKVAGDESTRGGCIEDSRGFLA